MSLLLGAVSLSASVGCPAAQTCEATLVEHDERTRAIVASHARPCDDDADCALFTLDVRCDDAGRAAFDDDRVAIGSCPSAVAVANEAAALSELNAFTTELCARPLEACTNGDFDCGGEPACRDGICVVDL